MSVPVPFPPPEDIASRLIEAALDAIVTIDATGRVVQFNAAAEAMFGYARETALGEPLADLIIPPELQAAHWAGMLRLVNGGESQILDRRVEMRARRRDGEEFPVELTVTRSSESPLLLTGFVRDLTSLKEAERRTADLQRVVASSQEHAHIGSWVFDYRTREATWSDEMYRILGLDPTAGKGSVERLLERVHPADLADRQAAVKTIVDEPDKVPPQGISAQYRIVRPDGTMRIVRTSGTVVRDEQGRALRWVGWGQDVTEWLLVEQELLARDAVSQALRDWESGQDGAVGLLRRFATALGFAAGSLWTATNNGSLLVCRAFWSAADIDAADFELATRGRSCRLGEDLAGHVWRSQEPLISHDLTTDPRFARRAAAAALGLRGGVAFPAVDEKGPVAVLSFYGFDRREHSERLVRTLVGVGRELGQFLSRHRAELEPRRLSDRELEVLRLAAEGNSGPEIASRLGIGPATVKAHLSNIYGKLGVGDRAAAVAHALRTGVIR